MNNEFQKKLQQYKEGKLNQNEVPIKQWQPYELLLIHSSGLSWKQLIVWY